MEGAASRKDGGIYLLASLRSQLSDPQVLQARDETHAHMGDAVRRVAFSSRSWVRNVRTLGMHVCTSTPVSSTGAS